VKPISVSSKNPYRSRSEITLPPADKLVAFRKLVAGSKIGSVSVGDEVAQHIESDFVNERQASSSNPISAVTGEDLARRMLIAR
jgi:hypothetical protein